MRTTRLKLPLLWPTLIFAILPSLALLRLVPVYRASLRRKHGLCPICGYDLRMQTSRCPECGGPREYNPNPAAIAHFQRVARALSGCGWMTFVVLIWLAGNYLLLRYRYAAHASPERVHDTLFNILSVGAAVLTCLVTVVLILRGKLPGTNPGASLGNQNR